MAVFAAVPTVNIFGLAQSLLVHAQQVKIKKKQFNFIENIFFKIRNQAVWGLSGLKLKTWVEAPSFVRAKSEDQGRCFAGTTVRTHCW